MCFLPFPGSLGGDMAAAVTEHIASLSVLWLLKSDTGSKPTAVYAQAPGLMVINLLSPRDPGTGALPHHLAGNSV